MAKKCMQCGGSTKKMQKGGTTSSPKLERLSGKVAKKTSAGKPVSKSLTKRYDKAVDKVITSGMKKMAKGGSTSFGMLSVKAGVDENPRPTAADRIAGAKMQYGGSNKQPISRITNNTSKEMRDAYNKKTQTNTTNTISKEYKVDPNTGQVSKQKLGGMMKKKMQKGGMMKGTVGGPPKKPFAAGIPYFTGAGQTGPESMQTGGVLSSALTAVKRLQRLKKTTGIANKAIKAKVDLKKGTTKTVAGPMTKTVKNIKAIAKKK